MHYLEPARLWLLLGAAGLAAAYVVMQRRRRQYAVRFTNIALLEAVAPKRPGWRRHATAAAFLVGIVALVVAFARPTHDEKVPRERATVIVAIDTSLSMQADDVSPTRFVAAKAAAKAFVDQLPSKINVGLVSFDGNARLDVSPTTDRAKVNKAIDRLKLNEGTAIGEAIFTALDAIRQQTVADDSATDVIPARIVLMSDGKTTVGRANDLGVAAAQKAKVPVSTIAFGTDHGEITVPQEPFPVPVPVDRGALQDVAQQTGGSFFSATSAAELQKVYADIGSSIGFDVEQREVSTWFVGAALLALLATAGMSLTWFNRLP
ncbi:MAG: Ca-activated chloride channel [Acidimicrobiaceae bacterium]|jgi:Ca-activated chloride channel family protein